MIELQTAFPYLGSRDYIHGTSILAGFIDALEQHGHRNITVKRLKFQRPAKTNGRLFLTIGPLDDSQAANANCTFQATIGGTVWRGLYAETGTPVEQRLAVEYPIADVIAERFGGRCTLVPQGRNDLIRALVEANKRFHELSVQKGVAQVRFGYMESWSVPPADTGFSGALEAKNLITRETEDGYMTINRLSYAAEDIAGSLTLCFDVIAAKGT
jgi:hypothetical protein